jgi:hypothetical protein
MYQNASASSIINLLYELINFGINIYYIGSRPNPGPMTTDVIEWSHLIILA